MPIWVLVDSDHKKPACQTPEDLTLPSHEFSADSCRGLGPNAIRLLAVPLGLPLIRLGRGWTCEPLPFRSQDRMQGAGHKEISRTSYKHESEQRLLQVEKWLTVLEMPASQRPS